MWQLNNKSSPRTSRTSSRFPIPLKLYTSDAFGFPVKTNTVSLVTIIQPRANSPSSVISVIEDSRISSFSIPRPASRFNTPAGILFCIPTKNILSVKPFRTPLPTVRFHNNPIRSLFGNLYHNYLCRKCFGSSHRWTLRTDSFGGGLLFPCILVPFPTLFIHSIGCHGSDSDYCRPVHVGACP